MYARARACARAAPYEYYYSRVHSNMYSNLSLCCLSHCQSLCLVCVRTRPRRTVARCWASYSLDIHPHQCATSSSNSRVLRAVVLEPYSCTKGRLNLKQVLLKQVLSLPLVVPEAGWRCHGD